MWDNKRWIEFCSSLLSSSLTQMRCSELSFHFLLISVFSPDSSERKMSQFILWCSNFNILAGNAYFTMWRHEIELRVFSKLFPFWIFAHVWRRHLFQAGLALHVLENIKHWWSQNHKIFEENMRKVNEKRKAFFRLSFRLSFIGMILQIIFYIGSHQFLRGFGCL